MSSEEEKRSKTLDKLYYGLRQTFVNVVNELNGNVLDEAQTKADYKSSFPFKSSYFKVLTPTAFIFDEGVYLLSEDGQEITIRHRMNDD